MRAGPMRHRCALFKPVLAKNKTGGFDTTWAPAGKVWAEITIPSGLLAPVAEQIKAIITAEIRVRPRSDLKAGCRLVEKGVTYLIEAALPDNDLSMLRLLCSNVPNP